MSDKETCRAIKRDGNRCTNRPQIAGFCRVHYPKDPKIARSNGRSELLEKLKTAGQLIAVSGGAIKLVESIIELWQVLPFGTGPQMPADYKYLASKVGPSWPDMPESYIPFNKGATTVDWRRARELYDRSLAVLQQATTPEEATNQEQGVSKELESLITALLDDMQPPFRSMLLQKLGSEGREEGV